MLQLKTVNLTKDQTETLIIPVCEDKDIHDNQTINSMIKKAKEIKEFKGEKDDELILYNMDQVKRVIFSGLGKFEKIDAEMLRKSAGKMAKKCIKKELSEVLFAVPSDKKLKLDMEVILEAMMSGAFLGNHIFDLYKKEKKLKPMEQISFLVKADAVKKFDKLPSDIETVCKGTAIAREWVSLPSNDKTPEQFAIMIQSLAQKEGLGVTVFDHKELKEKKFNTMLAVASGSQNQPRLVILEYRPKGAKKSFALVGKGVTFDSGGINLKPGSSLDGMKQDMAGGAAVAATLITMAKLKPDFNLIGVIPIVENMPSGSAFRPGDIIKSYEGKTVEIGNTDAEGRLILIDAMAYTIEQYKPEVLIDLATLTGACIVALGDHIAGLFSNDEKLAEAIIASGKKTHERCWNMPMPEDYKEMLKSEFADLNNVTDTRSGGAVTAALFLSEFVKDTRWAHIDIAGPAYIKKENSYCGAGGTGFGVRLLCDLLEKL